ncbi:hypothetical protein Taro_041459 [Colocasia esculenta]|uniref:Pectate lyase n=1 Tax=Colocasia esculenta TaxID=4460 RepID=A0A843WBJ4_COLES|nr:hypothetical protein [Colocasia esculenta]
MEGVQPSRRPGLVLSLVVFALAAATSACAHIIDFDESWQMRAKEAREHALEAFHEHPNEVTDQINHKVNRGFVGNSTRRGLRRKFSGPCEPTNPIDRCWRCRKNWATDRKRLAKCPLGFGRKALGGVRGRYYVVTDASDDDLLNPKPGTLRYACIQAEPLWIIFKRGMIIRLTQELMVNSWKTIDARGANVHIAYGAGITIQFVHHVIIHGLHIHDIKSGNGGMIRDSPTHYGFRSRSDGDGISIFGSSNIWIDHVSMSNCMDGLIDVVQGSTGITISNCHFTHHDHVRTYN